MTTRQFNKVVIRMKHGINYAAGYREGVAQAVDYTTGYRHGFTDGYNKAKENLCL